MATGNQQSLPGFIRNIALASMYCRSMGNHVQSLRLCNSAKAATVPGVGLRKIDLMAMQLRNFLAKKNNTGVPDPMADPATAQVPGQKRGMFGMPSVWGDLNLAGQNANQLSDQEQLQKKKKLMSAGRSNDFQSATSMLFGSRMQNTGSLGV